MLQRLVKSTQESPPSRPDVENPLLVNQFVPRAPEIPSPVKTFEPQKQLRIVRYHVLKRAVLFACFPHQYPAPFFNDGGLNEARFRFEFFEWLVAAQDRFAHVDIAIWAK